MYYYKHLRTLVELFWGVSCVKTMLLIVRQHLFLHKNRTQLLLFQLWKLLKRIPSKRLCKGLFSNYFGRIVLLYKWRCLGGGFVWEVCWAVPLSIAHSGNGHHAIIGNNHSMSSSHLAQDCLCCPGYMGRSTNAVTSSYHRSWCCFPALIVRGLLPLDMEAPFSHQA